MSYTPTNWEPIQGEDDCEFKMVFWFIPDQERFELDGEISEGSIFIDGDEYPEWEAKEAEMVDEHRFLHFEIAATETTSSAS